MQTRTATFFGAAQGSWQVQRMHTLVGEPLPHVAALRIQEGMHTQIPDDATWLLQGITSNRRYITAAEELLLQQTQEGLGRPQATCAALIPIRKSAAWWALPQDARRDIFEEQSKHNTIGIQYLPAIARRLYHCRDLGVDVGFDFLTWFEFAPEHSAAFDNLLQQLRHSAEWRYVDREVEIRLVA